MKGFKLHFDRSQVSEPEIIKNLNKLKKYTEEIENFASEGGYQKPEAFFNLPVDRDLIDRVKEVAKEVKTKKLKYVIVVGIGGSNLGTMAVYNAIFGQLDAFKQRSPKIIFIDTVSENLLRDVKDILKENTLSADEILLNVISKSGGTTETIANFEILYSWLKKKFGPETHDRVVATTDESSKLWIAAVERKMNVLTVPKLVGGRYSVFSPVGLFPLTLVGIDIDQLVSGAATMRASGLRDNLLENPAAVSAAITYHHFKKKISMTNTFFFNPQLQSVGMWYRQLVGESLGKQKDLDRKVVNTGLTPIVSVGSTDLHSMAQLYFGGPKDKLTTIIYGEESAKQKVSELNMGPLVQGIKNQKLNRLMQAIISGVKAAYKKNKLPVLEIDLPDLKENSLGQLLQFKMMEVMYLAHLMKVNAFDQPNVEDYKKETRRILEKK